MRKIIDGKAFDTKTATCVANWHNGHSTNDFAYCEKTLYRTPRGGWFLFGEGGPLSEYATHSGNSRGYGEQIIPMTPDEARSWLESYDFAAEFEEHFGPAEDASDEDGYSFLVRDIPAALHGKIKAESEETGKSMNQIFLRILKAGMDAKSE